MENIELTEFQKFFLKTFKEKDVTGVFKELSDIEIENNKVWRKQ